MSLKKFFRNALRSIQRVGKKATDGVKVGVKYTPLQPVIRQKPEDIVTSVRTVKGALQDSKGFANMVNDAKQYPNTMRSFGTSTINSVTTPLSRPSVNGGSK